MSKSVVYEFGVYYIFEKYAAILSHIYHTLFFTKTVVYSQKIQNVVEYWIEMGCPYE